MFLIRNTFILATLSVVLGVDLEHQAESRIGGGYQIQIEKAPWQGALKHNGTFICGAVIISEKFVLSAAHCWL